MPGAEVLGQRQEQLTKTLIGHFLKTHFLSLFEILEGIWAPLTNPPDFYIGLFQIFTGSHSRSRSRLLPRERADVWYGLRDEWRGLEQGTRG